MPSSSSHALIGGMVGATLASEGPSAVMWDGLIEKVAVPALVAPVLAMLAAGLAILVAYRIVGRQKPGVVTRGFRLGQLATSALFSLSHGTNDAQKTMGIIFLALVANGNLSADADIPTLGHRLGGDRDLPGDLLRRLADRAHDGLADHQDGPGAGLRRPGRGRGRDPLRLARRLPAVHHAGDVGRDRGRRRRQAALRGPLGRGRATSSSAWILTLPCSAAVGAFTYGVVSIFGDGSVGPIVVASGLLVALRGVLRAQAAARREAVPA